LSEQYKIIASDGKEYGPINEEQLKIWYQEERVTETTLVFVASVSQWNKLENIFNLGQWNTLSKPPVIKPLVIASIHSIPTPVNTTNSPIITPIPQHEIQGNKKDDHLQNNKNLIQASEKSGYFLETTIGILVFCLINVIFFLLTNGGILMPVRGIPWIVSLGIAGWVVTLIHKRRMQKRLGRKLWGQYELTSLNSWMEVAEKENKNKPE
jgi:GYF domain 2